MEPQRPHMFKRLEAPIYEEEKEVRINISDGDLLVIAKEAHKYNITINHMMERILVRAILADKKKPAKGPNKKTKAKHK